MLVVHSGRIGVKLLSLVLPLCLFLFLAGCREDLLTAPSLSSQLDIHFEPGTYYSYSNWLLDVYGYRIEGSRFRSSWTVADTGCPLHGRNDVAVIIDSVFSTNDSLVGRDSILIARDDEGYVLRYGFVAGLVAETDSVLIFPHWDRIVASSLTHTSGRIVGTVDTAEGGRRNETLYGMLGSTREYVAVVVNGERQYVLAYRVVTSRDDELFTSWIAESPTAFLKFLDQPYTASNDRLMELSFMVTAD